MTEDEAIQKYFQMEKNFIDELVNFYCKQMNIDPSLPLEEKIKLATDEMNRRFSCDGSNASTVKPNTP